MEPPGEDRAPREPGLLLFGLGVLACGGAGLATGTTIVFCPGNGQAVVWQIAAPGARVAAVGLLAVGVACLAYWRWQDRRRWPIPVGLVGLGVVAVGQVAAWIGWLVGPNR
jgi:hypothetical protein